MDLFGYTSDDTRINLLPYDGQANYFGPILENHADDYLHQLLRVPDWQSDIVKMFGKTTVTKRKYVWFGERPYRYNYSGHSRIALPMPKIISLIKHAVEQTCESQFNACLMNLYHTGEEGMGWHSDNEPEIAKDSYIASVSLGAERRFDFKHRTSDSRLSVMLEHGSLLIMDYQSQKHWLHQLPKSTKVTEPRVNMTFRRMSESCIAD